MLWPNLARAAAQIRGTAILFLACGAAPEALAEELYHDDLMSVRWDNTLSYTAAFRIFPKDPKLLENVNWDDGDRNFRPGLISNRFDLLSELELNRGDFGVRVSGTAWYDFVYRERNDNDSRKTFNPFSVGHRRFTSDVRSLHGEDARLGDAFVYGAFEPWGLPTSFRIGRYALLWGESVFFGENSIGVGQAPSDVNRELSQPSSYSNQLFLPVWQASLTVQPRDDIAISGYYQFAWRKDILPGAGSYFSYFDYLDAGGERIIIAPHRYLYRVDDLHPPDTGQFGLSLQISGSEFNYGLYALHFNAKEPETYLYLGRYFGNPIGLGDGTYRLVYPADIELYGASFSTYVADSGVAGEFSYRRNTPLDSDPQIVPFNVLADNQDHPLYAVGDTLHGQVSVETAFAASDFWQRADLSAEVAANYRVSINKNPTALDHYADRFAMAFHVNFTPQYYQVLPGLDVKVPIGFGYGLVGNSSVDETQTRRTGNFQIGISATYRTVWQGSLSFTHFIGYSDRQLLADRDFVALTFQRSF